MKVMSAEPVQADKVYYFCTALFNTLADEVLTGNATGL